jgi:hypothetical protein
VDKGIESLKLDMKVRHEFFLIFKSALRMIVEDAGGKETTVNLDHTPSKLVLKIRNTTVLPDYNNTSISQRMEEIKRRSSIISAESDIQWDVRGVSVIIIIPL